MHLLSLWPPVPPPSSCTCRLYYFKKCAKPPNSKKNLSIMGVGATERFTKKITASFSMWLLSLSNHDFTFELTLIQLSFNLEDHIINDWRFIWKSNGKSSRKILAGRNKAPQLQPVPILLHNSCYSQDTHAETFGRKAFRVQSMQLLLHTSWSPQDTLANSFGWEAFQLCTMRLLLHTSW